MVRSESSPPGGNQRGPGRYLFELSGGRLCLDFTNTVDRRPTDRPRELLGTYGDLLAWSRQSGILTPGETRRLGARAEGRREQAHRSLSRARKLRETLFQIFSATVKRRPAGAAIAALSAELELAFRSPRLRRRRLVWDDDREKLDFMLGPVVRSAVDLLCSPELDRVRLCAAEDCDWLFLDESRNRSRQWCDMTVCGNRAKARRFYRRKRSRPRQKR